MQSASTIHPPIPLHPSYPQQISLSNKILSNLSFQRVSCYLSSKFSLTLTKLSRVSTNGCINFFFILQFEGHHQLASNKKLFLRMANPHSFWKRIATENQVAMLRVVRERTQVPVPVVLDYCSDTEESGLGGEFVLMNFVDSDGDMEQYFGQIEEKYKKGQITRQQCFNIYKGLLEKGYKYVESLFKLDIEENHYICGFDLNLKPVPVNWDGPKIGPSKTIGSFLIQSLTHALFHFQHLIKTQSDASTNSQYQFFSSPLKSVLSDLIALQSTTSTFPSFFFHHFDFNPGNINIKDGKIVGVFDWEHSRMDIMLENWQELDLVDCWFGGWMDKEVYQRLREVQKGLTKEMTGKYARPEWEVYRKYWKICYIANDCWFYVANWWRNQDQSDWQKLVRRGAHIAFEKLRKLLTEAHYL